MKPNDNVLIGDQKYTKPNLHPK